MRGHRRVVVLSIVLVLLGGCSGIPDSSDVARADGSRSEEQLLMRIDPPAPTPDATPVEVVRGFVDAMRAFPVSTDTAAEYLTEDAVTDWRPQRQTVVYDELSATETPDSVVELSVRRIATIDARGTFTPTTGSLLDPDQSLRVERENGQWRISNPADALYVSADFFADYYTPVSLYFLDLSGSVLVPDPIYLPRGEQLATNLVQGLLAGPTSDLGDQVQTVVPPSTRVDVSVPVRPSGVAEVRLSDQVLALSDEQRQQLSAQVVWTLRQVAGIVGIRILAGGVPMDIPGVTEIQDLNSWDSFTPTDSSAGSLFALRRGLLVVVAQTSVSAFDGMWGEVAQDIADFDVNPAFLQLGAVSGDRTEVVVGPLNKINTDRAPRTLYRGGRELTDPTWDRNSTALWVVNHPRFGGSQLLVVDPSQERARRVSMGPLDRTYVSAFALSPDGVRFVAITRAEPDGTLGPARVMLGTVHLSSDTRVVERIADVHELILSGPVIDAPRDVGWTDAATVSVLGRVGADPAQPYDVRVDGSLVSGGAVGLEPLLGPVSATALATGTSPETLTYVGTRRGALWFQDPDLQWVRVSRYRLTIPDYPG